jgi:fatty-acyl-CoA synthase
MKVALTPMEFAQRASRLYAKREAVIDGDMRYTYEEFLSRCDRWSASLQKMGIRSGDRVAYIAPNTHSQLESFYAVPQIGAVLVPINYRLTAGDFAYIVNHRGARVLCVHSDYLDAIEGILKQLSGVERFVALEGSRNGWLDYEALIESEVGGFAPIQIDEDDLITINYTSGTTARPKGVMITHRNAYLNVLGTLAHFQMSPEDRYLWTLPMFHANGWTFVWAVTARGSAHVSLRKVDPTLIFELVEHESITTLCAAPTVLIGHRERSGGHG